MGLLNRFFTNCANPQGWMGRMMLRMMNFGHAPLTNWGLGFVEFQKGWTMLASRCSTRLASSKRRFTTKSRRMLPLLV